MCDNIAVSHKRSASLGSCYGFQPCVKTLLPVVNNYRNREKQLPENSTYNSRNRSPSKDNCPRIKPKTKQQDCATETFQESIRKLEDRKVFKRNAFQNHKPESLSLHHTLTISDPGHKRPTKTTNSPPQQRTRTFNADDRSYRITVNKYLETNMDSTSDMERDHSLNIPKSPLLSTARASSFKDSAPTTSRSRDRTLLTTIDNELYQNTPKCENQKYFSAEQVLKLLSQSESILTKRSEKEAENKANLLEAFKDNSDQSHNSFISNIKILNKVAKNVDVLHRVVYSKLASNTCSGEPEEVNKIILPTELIKDSSMQINACFLNDMQKFLDDKMRSRKIYEKITKTSVEDYLSNMLTLHSSIINKLIESNQEDVAVLILMLMKLNIVEFEDILASYRLNVDLHIPSKNTDTTEKVDESIQALRDKIKLQEEMIKHNELKFQRNVELLERKYERCSQERQMLERVLMENNSKQQLQ